MDIISSSNIKQTIKMMSMQSTLNQKETTEQAGFLGDGKLSAIITKMQSGQELSAADMEYLREKSPTTYDEAIKIEKEKKEYEKALRRCKTKEDARMLQLGKISEALSALKSGAADGRVVLAKLLKMTDAYVKFTGTKHYSKLAINHLELARAEKAKQKEKEKQTLDVEDKTKSKQASRTNEETTSKDQVEMCDLDETKGIQKHAEQPEYFTERTTFIKSDFPMKPIDENDMRYVGESKIEVDKLAGFRTKSKLDRRA